MACGTWGSGAQVGGQRTLATLPLTLPTCPISGKVSGGTSLPVGGGNLAIPQGLDRAPGLGVFTTWRPSRLGTGAHNQGDAWMELFLTSCQLHGAWVGGSLGPCPALWPRGPRILARGAAHAVLLVLGAARQMGVQEARLASLPPQVPSLVPRGPRAHYRLAPHLLPYFSSFLSKGMQGPPIQLQSSCPLCLDLASPGLCSRNLPTCPHLLQSHPTPTPTPKDCPSWPCLLPPGPQMWRCPLRLCLGLRRLGPGQLFSAGSQLFCPSGSSPGSSATTVAVAGLQRGSLPGPGPGSC